MSLVTFSVGGGTAAAPSARRAEDGSYIVPGKLFETGAWSDKGFSLSAAEADRAIEQARGRALPMDIEHKASVLDGHLGSVRRVWRDGSNLQAEFSVPSWLWNVTRGAGKPLRVSATWDRQTKRLKGAAWVLDPKIKDAELVAAFSNENRPHRQHLSPSPATRMTSSRIEAPPRRAGGSYMTPAQKKLRDLLAERGVGDKLTNEDLDAVFAEERDAQIAKDAEAFADRMIRIEKRAMPREKAYLVAQFSVAALDDHRGDDDTVSFSLGDVPKKATRVALLTASLLAREPHSLTTERLRNPADSGKPADKPAAKDAEFADDDLSLASLAAAHPSRPQGSGNTATPDAAPSQARIDQLLAASPLGQSVLADRQASNGAGNNNGGGR